MVDSITANIVAGTKISAAESSAGRAAPPSKQANGKTASANQPLNPRLVYDRLAGVVVTEFLNQSGNVQLQTPSSAVLAYLRVGLGADGYSKPDQESESTKQDTPTFDS